MAMRRRVGIQGIQQRKVAREKYSTVGAEASEKEAEQLRRQLNDFKENLEEFAEKYKSKINKNPEFRMEFVKMCTKIGVDPLASSKGFWAEVLGVGDFYYELAVQVIEVCILTREQNGGLVELGELVRLVNERRGKNKDPISEYDIERSIKKLHLISSGFDVHYVGGRKLVQSVPCELNKDHEEIMNAMEEGSSTLSQLKKTTQWTDDRIEQVLNVLLQEGMVWVDDHEEERQFWLMSLLETM